MEAPAADPPAPPVRVEPTKPPRAKQMSSGRTQASADQRLRAETTTNLVDDAVVDEEEKADTSEKRERSDSFGAATAGATAPMKPNPTTAQLHESARAAADRGDCETVRTLVRRIEKQDAAYYNEKVARDAALTACVKR